ncbi:MAG TPA: hypothetical protein VJJ82_05610 [Candidatus Nanoarchaeia archaeon]|nr:hypothetical protein [Candidatus Nanoarchaeia archaeon]
MAGGTGSGTGSNPAERETAILLRPLGKKELFDLAHYLSTKLVVRVEITFLDHETEFIEPHHYEGPARVKQWLSDPAVSGSISTGNVNLGTYVQIEIDSMRGSTTNPTLHDGLTRSLDIYLSEQYRTKAARKLLEIAVREISEYLPQDEA